MKTMQLYRLHVCTEILQSPDGSSGKFHALLSCCPGRRTQRPQSFPSLYNLCSLAFFLLSLSLTPSFSSGFSPHACSDAPLSSSPLYTNIPICYSALSFSRRLSLPRRCVPYFRRSTLDIGMIFRNNQMSLLY